MYVVLECMVKPREPGTSLFGVCARNEKEQNRIPYSFNCLSLAFGILACSCNLCCIGMYGKPREPGTTLLMYGQGKKRNRIPLYCDCLCLAWNSGMLL